MTISSMFVFFFLFFTSFATSSILTTHLCRNPIVSNHGHNLSSSHVFFSLLLPFIVSVALHVAFVAFVWFQRCAASHRFQIFTLVVFRSKTTAITIRILLRRCSQPKQHLPHRLHVPRVVKKSQPS